MQKLQALRKRVLSPILRSAAAAVVVVVAVRSPRSEHKHGHGHTQAQKATPAMGNSSSHTHEPLERGFTRGRFGDVQNGRAASFRASKRSSPKNRMDRIRRSFRDSFRRRRDRVPESSRPHQWQADEEAVRSATCSFPIKYLGCVEVFDSRGMQVCEEALKVLRSSRRRPVHGLLHVSGDGLRVVDDDTKGLIVDQTIEKVSFCAPDRSHERGFSYICRDGTTRRWMCHGFLARKDSGERLSHAVGCAFAVCLEKKQRRDKECGVTMTFDAKNSTFTRSGSFRQPTLTERLANAEIPSAVVAPQPEPPKPYNPFAIERPHATPSMLERQGSFRAFSTIGSQSPFKRQMSLRINDLPSNAERQKAFLTAANGGVSYALNVLHTPNRNVSPIPEASPSSKLAADAAAATAETNGQLSQLCQELSQGLSLLTQNDDLNFNNNLSVNQNIVAATTAAEHQQFQQKLNAFSATTTTAIVTPTAQVLPRVANSSQNSSPIVPVTPVTTPVAASYNALKSSPERATPVVEHVVVDAATPLPTADQWLGHVVRSTSPAVAKPTPPAAAIRPSYLEFAKATGTSSTDPFDAGWVASVAPDASPLPVLDSPSKRQKLHSTNPFISPPKAAVQTTFQVQL